MSEHLFLPLLPLKDVVIFPGIVTHLYVGRDLSIRTIASIGDYAGQVALVTQRHNEVGVPAKKDLYETGTLARVLKISNLPDGTLKVLLEGMERITLSALEEKKEGMFAHCIEMPETNTTGQTDRHLRSLLLRKFNQFLKENKTVYKELQFSLQGLDHISHLIDTITSYIPFKLEDKQKILSLADISARMDHMMFMLNSEIDLIQLDKRIHSRVKKQIDKTQKEYYLAEQLKAIQKEMGQEQSEDEVEQLTEQIKAAGLSKEAEKKAQHELNKYRQMSPMSAEANVIRTYLDWLVSLPWSQSTRVRKNIRVAEKMLDKDHYGLEDVKEYILEYVSVQNRMQKSVGSILCLVGPPGVGKTSLGRSIAAATNRKFARISLGGIRDEAEIRGHRRTYIGSLPGRIIQSMKKAGTKNPLFLLDEIDKIGADYRGDPSSALLEVLDPEQNKSFSDHYLEVDFDLSDVMFICTANTLNIPDPLLDRMEIIRIPGYTEEEKKYIAKQYLIPRSLEKMGVLPKEIVFADAVIQDIIRFYTKEAGVRSLEKQIVKIVRKIIKQQFYEQKDSAKNRQNTGSATSSRKKSNTSSQSVQSLANVVRITRKNISDYLGVAKYHFGQAEQHNSIGQVTGLAWTRFGGELLTIEAVLMPGKGKQIETGSLGKVMQESIKTAMTVVRARSDLLGIKANMLEKHDIHIHVPEGATPKDGPSAGIAMCVAIISVLTKSNVRANVAMTGEVTLTGKVLAIGGLKEKLLAAARGGIKTVLIPEENQKDLAEIPDQIKASIQIKPVRLIDEVFVHVFESDPRVSC